MPATGLGLDAWWDEPAYRASQGTFTERGTFILAKLRAHDAAKLEDVLADVYRNDLPDPADMTRFEWEVILRFMGASPDEIPLSASMVVRLREMQAASTNPLAFPARRGGLLRRFRTTYFQTVRKLGLAGTRLGIHALRHTWATRFYEATGDLLLLQRLGGWANLAMVQRYAHARQERAAAAIQQMVDAREALERREPPQVSPRGIVAVPRSS